MQSIDTIEGVTNLFACCTCIAWSPSALVESRWNTMVRHLCITLKTQFTVFIIYELIFNCTVENVF